MAAAGAFAVLLAGCGASDPEAATEPAVEAPLVTVVTVAPDAAASAVVASGLVGYRRETPLAFNVGGVIASITVDEGDVVRTGQPLASLRLTQVAAGSAEARAALETAQRQLERTEALFARGIVAQARLDDARLAVERARAARDSAAFTQGTAALTARASGVILRRDAEPAQVVGAGQPILILGETDSGWIVRVAAASAQASRLRVGQRATVAIPSLPGPPRTGAVARIAAKSDGATGAFDVEISISDGAGLRSGLVAEATVAVGAEATAGPQPLRAPALALFDARADQAVVFVVDAAGVARRRVVQTAGVDDAGVLIVAGLTAGERVIASGAAYVRDGEAVRIADAP